MNVDRLFIFLIGIIIAILVCGVLLETDKQKVSEYKPQSTSTVKQEDEDDCTYTMCNAFGGGIAGDTLAIQFMNGD